MSAGVLGEKPEEFGLTPAKAVSQPWIDGFALQSEHAKHALMHAAERFLADKTLKAFDAQCKLAQGEGPLACQAA